MIRTAISHMIPRQKIIDEFQFCNDIASATPISSNVVVWSNKYGVQQYDPHVAFEFMNRAGYYNSTISTTTIEQTKSSATESTPLFGMTQFILSIVPVQFIYKKRVKHSRKQLLFTQELIIRE